MRQLSEIFPYVWRIVNEWQRTRITFVKNGKTNLMQEKNKWKDYKLVGMIWK